MKEESQNAAVNLEYEARIVALVLGEASDFERDELSRLIEERPELAALKEQIQSVHGLLQEVGTGETVADDDWKLSAEKRSAVLAVIAGEALEHPAKQVVNTIAGKRKSVKRNVFRNLTKIAAVFCLVGFFGIMANSTIRSSRSSVSVRNRQLASSDGVKPHVSKDASASSYRAAVPSGNGSVMNGVTITAAGEGRAAAAGVAEFEYKKNLKSALSAIRDSLDVDASASTLIDNQDLPAVELGIRFDAGSFGATTPSFGDSDDGSGSTEGLNGPEPSSQQTTGDPQFKTSAIPFPDNPPLVYPDKKLWQDLTNGREKYGQSDFNKDAAERSSDLDGDGYRSADSPPAVQEPVNVELSLPSLSVISGQRNSADAAEPAGSTMSGGVIMNEAMPFADAAGKPESTTDVPDRGSILWDRHKEELTKDSVITPGDNDITLPGDGALFFSAPVAGTEIGQPRDGRRVASEKQESPSDHDQESNRKSGRLNQDFGTSPPVRISIEDEETDQTDTITIGDVPQTEERVKSSLGELANLREGKKYADTSGVSLSDDGLSRAVNKDVDRYGRRPQSDPKVKQSERIRSGDRPAIRGRSVWSGYVPPMSGNTSTSANNAPVKKSTAPVGLNEKTAEEEAFSTFSLHVSDVSFQLAQAALARGEWPEAAMVRIEEFVNAFDYGDPMPSQSEKVSCRLEQSVHPFLQQRNMLRVSMRTGAAGRSRSTPLRLTFLLDNSGSMERPDRQQTVRRAFALLAQQLTPIDQVTLISFARQPRLLADKVSGAQSQQLVQLIENLPSEGGTNIEAALQLALEKAREQQVDGAQNRIILLTDGAVNLGDANPASLSQMITTMRNTGIAFDAAGISAEGLNDEILEALTRQGDGRYYLLDSLEAADDGFARQIAGALRPSAKNVKVQVEFNPKRVGRYKLLGFEKHRLKQEDFRNDQVDAAELAAAEAGVAVYQFEAKPDGEGDVGSVSVRFRDLSTGQMIENRWPIPYEADAPRPDQAAPSLRIATSAALLAAKLRGEPLGEIVDLKTLSDLIAGLPERDRNAYRVPQLQRMIQQARQMSGE